MPVRQPHLSHRRCAPELVLAAYSADRTTADRATADRATATSRLDMGGTVPTFTCTRTNSFVDGVFAGATIAPVTVFPTSPASGRNDVATGERISAQLSAPPVVTPTLAMTGPGGAEPQSVSILDSATPKRTDWDDALGSHRTRFPSAAAPHDHWADAMFTPAR